MSRRRPVSGATISLFPFLAVLLCTMGALLVLLVIFSRRAQEAESAGAMAAEQARVEELELARDELRWRVEQLRGVRERTAADLARERLRLAGVEEDSRKLADELDALERTAESLAQGATGTDATEAVAEAERRLAAARAELDAARAKGAKKPAAYAVVPYAGGNGTHRRPLYIECCIDGVFLQPEGIRLGPGDFEGPPGPGNPLANALRAAREHIARSPGDAGDPAVQPYPLLLVRPSGVMAYYAAREAITSWGSEFGYQFVDEDWQLTYPPADPALADVERRAIDESRRRLEWLAQVRPAKPARPTQQYRASTTRGGVVAEGGPTVLGDQSRFDWKEEQASAGGHGGPGGDGDGLGTSGAGGGDVVLGGGGRDGGTPGGTGRGTGSNAAAGDRYAGPSRFYSGASAAGGTGGTGTGGPDGVGGPHAEGASLRPTDATGTPGGQARAGGGTNANGSTAVNGGGTQGPGGGGSAAGSGAAGGAGGGGAMAAAGASGGAAGAGSGGSAGGPALPGMMQAAGGSAGASGSAAGSLAGSRGSNWASLATAERPIPVTRPIRVECAADEFRIFDDSGTRVETRIPIGTRTADAVDPLVQSVHGRVGRWGLAGERMYWRPELVLSETADGRSRREDLERLLADSGLDTRHDRADAEVRLLPPVSRATAAGLRR